MGSVNKFDLKHVPPLADVACCHQVLEARVRLETPTRHPLRPNEVLDGRFLIHEAMSYSGMATIYRAEDMLGARHDVAVKVPLLSVESDPVLFRLLRREEEIGLKLSHPYLQKYYPVGEKIRPYIVTEFLRGRTLDYLRFETRPLEERDALTIVSLICEALEYMHGRGFIHQDLKPANIMICCDQTLRLMDFGVASPPIRKRSVFAKLTPTFGTPEYMAPEQVENGSIDERSDVYGLGAILYELLTGVVPFKSEHAWQSAIHRITGDPTAPRKVNPSLSPQAEEIVLHAMQRSPSDRYQSMREFRADLIAPARVAVTGYCERLRLPRRKISLQGTPMIAGLLLALGVILFLISISMIVRFYLPRG